jgi:drug/metabolite transporter (DMT)-like permease
MTKKIQKSLIIIVCITIGGYLISVAYLFVVTISDGVSHVNILIANSELSKYIFNFAYVGMAASYYIYFYNSTEYRIAFVAILRNCLGCTFLSRFIPKHSIKPIVAFIGKSQSHPIPVDHQ